MIPYKIFYNSNVHSNIIFQHHCKLALNFHLLDVKKMKN